MNIVKRIRKANLDRDPERLMMKDRALRDSPFPFLRGTCHLFHDHRSTTRKRDENPGMSFSHMLTS